MQNDCGPPSGAPAPAGDQNGSKADTARAQKEAEELASFKRRAEWWDGHYGTGGEDVADLRTKAIQDAENMPGEPDPPTEP